MTTRAVQQAGRQVTLSNVTVTPASVATISAAEQSVTLPGLMVGDALVAFPAGVLTAGITVRASIVNAASALSFRCVNPTAAPVAAAASLWALANLRALPQRSITLTPAAVAAASAAGQNLTIPGLLPGDCILAIPPPTLIAGVDFIAARVVTANTLPLIGVNPTAAPVTPAAGVWRLVNLRGLVRLVTLTLGAVGAATAGNIDLTVPGLLPGDCLIAIPPAGLAAGVFPTALRAPAANTLRLRVANPTAAPVTPGAGVWALANLGNLR